MVKLLLSKIYHSHWKISDAFSILYSLLFYPKNVFISNSIRILGKGKISAETPFFFGIGSNKMGLDMRGTGQLEILRNATVAMGKNVRIARACKLHVHSHLAIGDNTYIQANATILVRAISSIGKDCAIGWNFQMLDDDLHHIIENGSIKNNCAPVIIGNHVWIGSNVTILKGVTIGSNSIVASGCVVTKSFPECVLIAGNPAKVVKSAINWQ